MYYVIAGNMLQGEESDATTSPGDEETAQYWTNDEYPTMIPVISSYTEWLE